jgi:hypothetical protein
MPAAEFPSSYSAGYNPSDIFAVEVNYGGPNGFHALVEAAHNLGIGIGDIELTTVRFHHRQHLCSVQRR